MPSNVSSPLELVVHSFSSRHILFKLVSPQKNIHNKWQRHHATHISLQLGTFSIQKKSSAWHGNRYGRLACFSCMGVPCSCSSASGGGVGYLCACCCFLGIPLLYLACLGSAIAHHAYIVPQPGTRVPAMGVNNFMLRKDVLLLQAVCFKSKKRVMVPMQSDTSKQASLENARPKWLCHTIQESLLGEPNPCDCQCARDGCQS